MISIIIFFLSALLDAAAVAAAAVESLFRIFPLLPVFPTPTKEDIYSFLFLPSSNSQSHRPLTINHADPLWLSSQQVTFAETHIELIYSENLILSFR